MAKPYRKLSVKLLMMLVLAAAVSLLLNFILQFAGEVMIREVYCAESRKTSREVTVITEFRNYVKQNAVISTDAERIGAWNRDYPFVQLTVQGKGAVVSADWSSSELVLARYNGIVVNVRTDNTAGGSYTVNFRDGAFLVEVREFSENRLYTLLDGVTLAISALFYLLLVLLYSSRITTAVTRLARQVRQVSRGDLSLEIHPTSRDEIGDLALDVDGMRLSILDKLHREEQAWQANTELITAISHDVRTPLTTLMGYLELLQQPDLTQEQRDAYLRLCSGKAEKLRRLTDQLFSYFLVFGKPEPDAQPEAFRADTLMEQLLGEGAAELMAGGFDPDLRQGDCDGVIRVDVQHLRRIFDNLISNIRKYADPAQPVVMEAEITGDVLRIRLSNAVAKGKPRGESTKIGLRTCEKLMTAMGGSFQKEDTGGQFAVMLTLPVCERAGGSLPDAG